MMKYLIVGRTGVGKDHLVGILEKLGLKRVVSCTTREPRSEEDKKLHIFISPEEAENYPDKLPETETIVNGHTYFATRKAVEEADMYVIDPKGVYGLTKAMPDTSFQIIYVMADNDATKTMAIARAEDKEKEKDIFEKRTADEDAMFTEFENKINEMANGTPSVIAPNVVCIHPFVNTFNPTQIERIAGEFLSNYEIVRKLTNIVNRLIAEDVIRTENGKVRVKRPETEDAPEDPITELISIDKVVDTCLTSPENLHHMIMNYLALPDTMKNEPVATK